MTDQEKQAQVTALVAAGRDAAVHGGRVVVFYRGYVWHVVGGDAKQPTLRRAGDIDATKVRWRRRGY